MMSGQEEQIPSYILHSLIGNRVQVTEVCPDLCQWRLPQTADISDSTVTVQNEEIMSRARALFENTLALLRFVRLPEASLSPRAIVALGAVSESNNQTTFQHILKPEKQHYRHLKSCDPRRSAAWEARERGESADSAGRTPADKKSKRWSKSVAIWNRNCCCKALGEHAQLSMRWTHTLTNIGSSSRLLDASTLRGAWDAFILISRQRRKQNQEMQSNYCCLYRIHGPESTPIL